MVKRENKKEDILKASLDIFVNEGFDRPSMDSIASRANVSKRTLYKHFPNKHALLNEILIKLINQSQSEFSFTFHPDRNIAVQLQDVVDQKVGKITCPSNLMLAKIILSEFLKDKGILKEMIEEVLKNETATLRWIQAAQKAKALTKDASPLELLERLNELINGIFFFPILFGKKDRISPREVEELVKMFLHVNG